MRREPKTSRIHVPAAGTEVFSARRRTQPDSADTGIAVLVLGGTPCLGTNGYYSATQGMYMDTLSSVNTRPDSFGDTLATGRTPNDPFSVCEAASLQSGQFLLLVRSSAKTVTRTRRVLHRARRIVDIANLTIPASNPVR